MTKRVIVLGALSAVGEAACRLYAAEGASLLLAARRGDRLDEVAADLKARGAAVVETVVLDLDTASPAQTFPELVQRLGGVDHVLVAYGALGDQDAAEKDEEAAKALLSVNFNSAALWCLAAANVLEARRSGSLVAIGSVAGDRGRQSNYVYGAAKAGLGVLMQGIAHRLAAVGAHAAVVKPGFIETPMTAHIEGRGGPLWAKPEAVARIIRKAAEGGPPIVYAPWFWQFILLIIRVVPAPIFHKTKL